MAELWGSVVVSLLFWGFANQVTIFLLWSLQIYAAQSDLAAIVLTTFILQQVCF